MYTVQFNKSCGFVYCGAILPDLVEVEKTDDSYYSDAVFDMWFLAHAERFRLSNIQKDRAALGITAGGINENTSKVPSTITHGS